MKIEDFESLEKLRAAIKRDLDELPPGVTLSTAEMVNWIMEKSGAEPQNKFLAKLVFDAVRSRPLEVFAGYTTPGEPKPGTSHFTKGKMITPIMWHRPAPLCEYCGGTGRK